MVVKKMANKEEAMQHKGELMDDQADVFDVSDHEDLDLEGTMSLASKAKQLPQVDHTRVYYRPFRREFYIEVPELAKMTEEGKKKIIKYYFFQMFLFAQMIFFLQK